MATKHQIATLSQKIKEYKRKYLRKEYSDLDESATRIMTNSFLTDVLGYTELDDIKTEYRIRGEYADYVIQVNRKKHFIVEVKAVEIDLSEKHLRQSVNYAANEGIDWILLLNGRQVELYRVLFGKPIQSKKVFSFDLSDNSDMKVAPEHLVYLTKRAIEKNELEDYWKRCSALAPEKLAELIYSKEVVKVLRKLLKNETDIYFQIEDISAPLLETLVNSVELAKPKFKATKKKN